MCFKLCKLTLLLIAALVAVPVLASVAHPSRLALVIGNSEYKSESMSWLPNPVNDAKLMARTLRGLGFEVVLKTNANREVMSTAFSNFRDRVKSAGRKSVALFFYAGHGIEFRGKNYLIPLDAKTNWADDLPYSAIDAQIVIEQLMDSTPALVMMVLDACRNNRLPSKSRSAGQGLGGMGIGAPGQSAMIAFAAAPGQTATDGPSGGNSPYTRALVEAMTQSPRLEVGMVFRKTSDIVSRETNSKQRPWTNSSLGGTEFYFREPSGEPGKAPGVYLAVNVTHRQRIEPSHLEEVNGDVSSADIRNFRQIESGCYSRSIQRGERLGWRDVSANCPR